MLSVVLDPGQYEEANGDHDSAQHLGSVLSLDRLFACVTALLVASRRDEFVRKTLLFEALDIVDGLTRRSGDYSYLLSYVRCAEVLSKLQAELPLEVQRLVLPRCAAAVDALLDVVGGFFITERNIDDLGLNVAERKGTRRISWTTVIYRYLRMLRNGAHSFRDVLNDEAAVSMMSAHTGRLAPELADIAYLHLVDLLVHPSQLAPRSWPHPEVHAHPDLDEVWNAVSSLSSLD
jgi:hypothetical protein